MTPNIWILTFSILSSSLIGSWHCAGMCGPIATFVAQAKGLRSYHLGRGIAYTGLGGMAGWLGKFFLQSDFYWMRIFSGILLVMTVLIMGLNLFFDRKNRFLLPTSFFKKWMTKSNSSFFLGLLSVFLPCGWLYTYALAAAASQSAFSGALVMALFWLGSIPALSAFPVFVRKTLAISNRRKQKIAGGILIFASIYSIFSFYFLHSAG